MTCLERFVCNILGTTTATITCTLGSISSTERIDVDWYQILTHVMVEVLSSLGTTLGVHPWKIFKKTRAAMQQTNGSPFETPGAPTCTSLLSSETCPVRSRHGKPQQFYHAKVTIYSTSQKKNKVSFSLCFHALWAIGQGFSPIARESCNRSGFASRTSFLRRIHQFGWLDITQRLPKNGKMIRKSKNL